MQLRQYEIKTTWNIGKENPKEQEKKKKKNQWLSGILGVGGKG